MASYSFLTTWAVAGAPIERVYDAIHDTTAYPGWWRGVEEVERLEEGDTDGVGGLDRYVWKSTLPYRLEFSSRTTRAERPHLMEGEAFGELDGHGRWRLWESPAGVCITYQWDVKTTEPWMNVLAFVLAPIARPVFAWNHDYVMRNGGEGLARLLGAQLLFSD